MTAAAFAPITALLLSVALLLMGNGLQGTLLPVRANLEDFSPTDIGILGSAYFFGFAAGCLYGPRLIRRAGPIRAFRSEERRLGKEWVRTGRSRWSSSP